MALRRTLGPVLATFYGIGMIVGAGIYSVIGAAAGEAGEGLWLSFAIGAFAAILSGLSYAELVAMHPKAGAEYIYLREAFPKRRWIPTMIGCALILSGVATASTVTTAFAGYLNEYVALPGIVVAGVMLVALSGVSIAGIRESALLNVVFTLLELGGLALVVAVAVVQPDVLGRLATDLHPGVIGGAALVFFAYLGFEQVANLAEETRDPTRTIPRVLLISVAVTTVLYVAVALTVVTLLPPEQLAGESAPLAAAVSERSPTAARVLGAIALIATANTGLIALVSTSRLVFGMARDGALPPAMATLLPGRKTPWLASAVLLGLALALLPLGGVDAIASVSSFGALLAFVAVDVALVVLRVRKPRARRPFAVPWAIGPVPIPTALAIAISLALVFALEPLALGIGVITLAVGALIAFTRPFWNPTTPTAP
jgi:APA family basic amino acid/polyamine antiporter